MSISHITVQGSPRRDLVRTSHVKRANLLTIRMQLRRFTRRTNGFSKKLDNLKAALALFFAWYIFVRIHRSLAMTPAMAAGVATGAWAIDNLIPRN